jgi:hypothetical protein
MRNRSCWFFALLAAMFLVSGQVSGLSLKARADVIYASGTVTIGEIAEISPWNDAQTFSSLSAGMDVHYPTVFSPEGIVSRVDKAIDGNFAYSGGPALVVPESMRDSTGLPFLLKLMDFLCEKIKVPYDRLEIVSVQGLPLIHSRDRLEFFVKTIDPRKSEILYRSSGRSSYRRSGVEIRRTEVTSTPVLPVAVSPTTGRVRNGEKVDVLFVSGMIQAEFQGSAMESGVLTEIISVRIDDTGKVIDARITASGEVRVDY